MSIASIWSRLVRTLSSDHAGRIATVLSTAVAAIGIWFAGEQLRLQADVERRQTTAGILKGTRESALLQVIRRLELHRSSDQAEGRTLTGQVIEDRDLLLNTYDSLAIYYNANTLDRCLVKVHTRAALDTIISILEYLKEPQASYARIVRLRESLDSISCPSHL